MMQTSTIAIDVQLDDEKVPQHISWSASDDSAQMIHKAKAIMVSFWDGADKTALRIDLWTKEMMIDEMADFYYQTLMTMADAFRRATNAVEQAEEMQKFAKDFYAKFREKQLETNKFNGNDSGKIF